MPKLKYIRHAAFLFFLIHTSLSSNEHPRENRPVYLTARMNEGKGIGFNHGYATAEAVIFPKIGSATIPFFDLRYHHFYNNHFASNAGIGLRILTDACNIFGVNGFYDFRNSKHGVYNQLGGGFEWISNRWAFYLNGYVPVGGKRATIDSCYQTQGSFFLSKTNFEIACPGVNFEARFCYRNSNSLALDWFGGPYYYKIKCENCMGGQIGLLGSFWRWVNIGITGSYDSVFQARIQGIFAITIPLGSPKETANSCNFSNWNILQHVRRNEIMVLSKRCKWEWNY